MKMTKQSLVASKQTPIKLALLLFFKIIDRGSLTYHLRQPMTKDLNYQPLLYITIQVHEMDTVGINDNCQIYL